jgi:hypothetical protein
MAESNADIGRAIESEYMAASAAAKEAIWLNRLLEELGFRMPKPIKIYEDMKAAILFSYHPEDHRRSKHIDTRNYFIREAVINGEIMLEYIPTLDKLVDGLITMFFNIYLHNSIHYQ